MVAKNARNNTVAREIQKQLEKLTQEHHMQAQTFSKNLQAKLVHPDYAKEKIRHDEWGEKVSAQLRRAERLRDEQTRAYEELHNSKLTITGNNATEELLAETRATKQWARIERELTGKSTTAVFSIISTKLQDAAKRGDQSTLAGIASEAPSFLRSVGVENPEAVVDNIIRTHEPDLQAAHAAIGEAEQLIAITRHNTNIITKAFEEGFRAGTFGTEPAQLRDYEHIINAPEVIKSRHGGDPGNYGAVITEEEPEVKISKFNGKPIREPYVAPQEDNI